MRQLVIILVALASTIPTLHGLPIGYPSQPQALYIGPDNVEALASYLDNSLIIEDRAIRFGSGSDSEKLIEIPLGFVEPHATIRVTVGLDNTAPSAPAQDHDPFIGISDGSMFNEFWVNDAGNYAAHAPCVAWDAASQDDKRVSERTYTPAQGIFTFRPLRKYGACYLPLDGGYVNTATFMNKLETSRSLSFTVRRDAGYEEYRFYYFVVEIF